MLGGGDVTEVSEKKSKAIEIFEDATSHLRQWHSNVESLEKNERRVTESRTDEDETTFAKHYQCTQHNVTSTFMGQGKRYSKRCDEQRGSFYDQERCSFPSSESMRPPWIRVTNDIDQTISRDVRSGLFVGWGVS